MRILSTNHYKSVTVRAAHFAIATYNFVTGLKIVQPEEICFMEIHYVIRDLVYVRVAIFL